MKVIGAAAILFIFVSCDQLPRSRSMLAKKKDCAEAGWKWFEETKRNTAAANTVYDAPQFAYNKRLDTCLCYYQTMAFTSDERHHDAYVVDVLKNKTLLTHSMVNGRRVDGVPDFGERRQALMDQDR